MGSSRCPIRKLKEKEVAFLLQRSGNRITEEFFAEYSLTGDHPHPNVALDQLPSECSGNSTPSSQDLGDDSDGHAAVDPFENGPCEGKESTLAAKQSPTNPCTTIDAVIELARVVQVFFASSHGKLHVHQLDSDQRYNVSVCATRWTRAIPPAESECDVDLHWSRS